MAISTSIQPERALMWRSRLAMGRTQFFVVGTGRCGSTLLSDLLRDFSAGLSLSEFFTVIGGPETLGAEPRSGVAAWRELSALGDDACDLLRLAPGTPELLWRMPILGDTRPSPLELVPLPHLGEREADLLERAGAFVTGRADAPMHEHYEALFDWLRRRFRKHYWIERSGGSLAYVSDLIEHFPCASFIHLFREGPACAASMARHPFFRVRVARALARNPALPVAEALQRDVPTERFGAYWSAVTQHGVRALERLHPARVLHVAYEDMVSDPGRTWGRILAFLGDTAPNRNQNNQVISRVHSTRPHPTPSDFLDDEALRRSCRPGMRATRRFRFDRLGLSENAE